MMLLPLLFMLHLPTALHSIHLSQIRVPNYGVQDKDAVLSCHYDSQIYSIKWYKNGKEFFSYLPGKRRPSTVHQMNGVHVDISQSDQNKVTLRNLSLASTGRYRCEVSSDAPMFATDSRYGDLLVVVVPANGPTIEGANDRYARDELVDVNCTTKATKPPTNLTWYINQELVLESELVRFPIINVSNIGQENLHTNTLGLRHKVTRSDFKYDRHLKIKCVASIYDAYYEVNEISPQKASSDQSHHQSWPSSSEFLNRNSGSRSWTMSVKTHLLLCLLLFYCKT